MTYREWATHFDREERPMEAAWAYELAITAPEADLELYLDLVGLYLSCEDSGFASAHGLSVHVTHAMTPRVFELLG